MFQSLSIACGTETFCTARQFAVDVPGKEQRSVMNGQAARCSVLLLTMRNTTSVDNPILAARKTSPLRQRMIDDMTVRNFAPNTILCDLKQVSYFAQHFGKSQDRLGPEEIRS
jgi:hypothetical protein